ncbi:MAG: ATP-binding protein [Acidimicrobiaceae bacterium]|nr:ATP-binding protein [Acidimicrobiaceae bacterium]MYD06262.1 ATP-binding protein [Acidimicrobiaceae bacterium]MYI59349.1 ATP-binding protein [Acidimicrobiaceae bacterium]
MERYVPRLVDPLIAEYLEELPAVMLIGPRACGKTTTAANHARSIVRLDSGDAAAFVASPDAALRDRSEPLLLDEWQMVPEVLGAVKRAVDSDRRSGRYLITSSARTDIAERFWPGTGRIVILRMYPLTVAEQQRRTLRPFIDRLAAGESLTGADRPTLDLRDYLQLAMRGGFPEPALELGETTIRVWLEGYADQVAMRDARAYDRTPDAGRLLRYLEAYAINSSGAVHHQTLYDAAGINRKTALAYDTLLRDLMVVDELPAWSTNRLKRLSKTPERYVIDSGLLAGILRVGIDDVLSSSNLLGSMLDTFVVAQLRAEAVVAATRYRLSHLREQNGRREIDLVAELGGGRIAGIEIKASTNVGRSDARHLQWLQETMGDRFAAGVVLHTGRDTFELADRIIATPISALWS